MSIKSDVQLRPHQNTAVEKVLKKDGNLLLSHATGSGKTLTALASFEALRKAGKANKALIIAPASLRHNFAEQGIEKFTDDQYVIFGNKQEASNPDPRFVDPDQHFASGRSVPYHIVSYDMFKKSPERYIAAAGADTLIYDEIHRGKNEATNITQVMKSIRPQHRNFIGLTGSIVSNTPGDIVPLVDAMTNGEHRLGSKAVFNARFLQESPKEGNKQLINKNIIKGLTAPYIDHVETSDLKIAAPPKKELKTVKVTMGTHQEDLYRYLENQLDPATKLKLRYGIGGKKLKERELAGIFSKLMTVRQLSNYTKSLNPEISHEQALSESPKMQRVLDDIEKHLAETPDAQIVVGSQFISAGIEPLIYHLKARGHDPAVFIGKGNLGSSETSRQQSIRDFNEGRKKILLISGAGGEGLNLPNTTKIMMLDGHYNPEVMQQMEARGIRAGGQSHRPESQRKVEVVRYMSKPSLRKMDVAMKTLDAISPNTYLNRLFDGQPLWQNPLNRPKGPDELIGQIAKRKEEINQDIKGLWKKAAKQVYKSKIVPGMLYDPKQVMTQYLEEFGDKLEADAPTDSEGWFDREREQLFIEKYRQIMMDIANKYPTGQKFILKSSPFTEQDFENNKLKATRRRGEALGTAAKTAIPFTIIGMAMGPAESGMAERVAGGIGAGIGGSALTYYQMNKMYRDGQYITTPMTQARRARNLTDEEIRSILRGQVVKQKIEKEIQHYL